MKNIREYLNESSAKGHYCVVRGWTDPGDTRMYNVVVIDSFDTADAAKQLVFKNRINSK